MLTFFDLFVVFLVFGNREGTGGACVGERGRVAVVILFSQNMQVVFFDKWKFLEIGKYVVARCCWIKVFCWVNIMGGTKLGIESFCIFVNFEN